MPHEGRDEDYRAIGRYFVAFAELVEKMRHIIAQFIGGGEGNLKKAAEKNVQAMRPST